MTVMSVKDPNCGECKTLKSSDGKSLVIDHAFPKQLDHYYPLPALGDTSIPVHRGHFDHEGTRFRGLITVDLEPRPRLVAQGVRDLDFAEGVLDLGNPEPAKWVDYDTLSIPARKLPAPARTARPPRPPRATAGFRAVRRTHLDAIDAGNPNDLDYLTFYLFNGWFGNDGMRTCCGGQERRGRIDTTLDDWQLRIEPRGDISSERLRKHQRETGLSTVTHVGRIRRDDGGKFAANEAVEVLSVVESLSGFALGRVTAIVLPVGYRDGKATWSRWKCNRAVDRPLGPTPFLDRDHTASQMTELFRAGYDTSKNSLRWDVFKYALGYHYATEYDANVNMEVMLPVSAIQLISFAHLVEELPAGDPNHLTSRQWNARSLGTIGQLRNVLSVAGVDMSVPAHLVRLAKVQADIADSSVPHPDALDCVVPLRNKVAHPKQRHATNWTTEEWAETGFAATTMFNVLMLWWLGYDERFLGKTSEYRGAGDSIYVPWHQP